jgi:hypothetical protein
MADEQDVRRLALELPATVERPSYGTPGFRVKDKLFARLHEEPGVLVLWCESAHDEQALMAQRPEAFFGRRSPRCTAWARTGCAAWRRRSPRAGWHWRNRRPGQHPPPVCVVLLWNRRTPAPSVRPMTTSTTLAARLAGAFLVGALLTPVGLLALLGVAFGAWHVAAGAAAGCFAVSTALLAAIHRGTQGRGSSLRWGAGVSVAGAALAALCALAWMHGGGTFGRSQAGWVAGVGVAFLICAAAASRPTRVPAAAAAVALVAVSLASLAPAIGDRLPERQQRGCIASSHEQALRECG